MFSWSSVVLEIECVHLITSCWLKGLWLLTQIGFEFKINQNVGLSPMIPPVRDENSLLGFRRVPVFLPHHGGGDWVADNGLFRGKKRTLYPVGILKPGKFDYTQVTDFYNLNDVISPGDQGTKGGAEWGR